MSAAKGAAMAEAEPMELDDDDIEWVALPLAPSTRRCSMLLPALAGAACDRGAPAPCRDYDQQAFERRYVDDHSWEQLEEDEQGRLRLVRAQAGQRGRPAV